MVELEGSLNGEALAHGYAGASPSEPYLVSFEAISATCLPCQRAPASSISEGMREPSPPAMVLAP